MTKDELQKIIDLLESSNRKDDAYFGISQLQGGDESFIKANKEGLELFAADLLKASRDADDLLAKPVENVFHLQHQDEWVEQKAAVVLEYIQLVKEKPAPHVPQSEGMKRYVEMAGCFALVLLAVAMMSVGAITMVRWVLN